MVAANAPDVDMLSFARGEYFALAFRRGITHGWPALVVLPFVVTAGVLAWDRWVRRKRDPTAPRVRPPMIFALSVLGLLTHPSLDWLNTYGMRWGLPFDGSWTYGDALFIIDPWIWLSLGGAVFLVSTPSRRGNWGWVVLGLLTTTLVVLGMGGVPAVVWVVGVAAVLVLRIRCGTALPQTRPRAVRGALAFSAAYIAVMITADLGARQDVFAAAPAEGIQVRDVLVAPRRGNPFLADIEVQTDDAYVPGTHDWRRVPRVLLRPHDAVPLLAAPGLDGQTVSRVVAAARSREPIDDYLVWSRYPYVRVTPEADGWRVSFRDARYDDQPEAGGLAGLSVLVLRSDIQ